MNTSNPISIGLDQAVSLVSSISAEQLDLPTPCSKWTVRELTDHIVNSTAQMAVMARGEKPDWGSLANHHDDPAKALREAASEIRSASDRDDFVSSEGMIAAELSVHTWGLATALSRNTDELEPRFAEAGLTFMSASLGDENRGDAFAPEQPAPDGANAYERIAAFAGRAVQA